MARVFRDIVNENRSRQKFLCVGLDPDTEKIPKTVQKAGLRESIVAFNRAIIDASKDIVCAYKPNSAFFEAYGEEGIAALRETCAYLLQHAPDAAIILDAKRGDIGSTNEYSARFAFDHVQADAITLHPYTGAEGLAAFLARKDKGCFIYCRSSNAGASEFQDLDIGGEPLYIRVAQNVAEQWNVNDNCGLVVGATYPTEIEKVRKAAPHVPLLIPGVGTQGGDLAASVRAANDGQGGFVLSVSRAILYASSGPDFADAARAKALELDAAIRAGMNI